jgi:hypothetical protein
MTNSLFFLKLELKFLHTNAFLQDFFYLQVFSKFAIYREFKLRIQNNFCTILQKFHIWEARPVKKKTYVTLQYSTMSKFAD